ncbi:MAG TPA: hypothetical protein ENN97_07210 [Phycisphaerales bacterium]|nr:hypothetical protein [Phycisphaerales bacterium]
MNAEQVINKILAEARQQAEAIVQEASEKRDQKMRQLEDELSAYREETERLAVEAAEDRRSRMLATARMENARAMLKAKTELLDEVFAGAEDRIARMPDEPYKALVTKLMSQAVETGDEEVIVGKDEKRITGDLIKQVNRQLGTGFKGNLRLSDQRADIKGGFILKRGRVQVNAAVEVLVGRLREAMEMELAARLFG